MRYPGKLFHCTNGLRAMLQRSKYDRGATLRLYSSPGCILGGNQIPTIHSSWRGYCTGRLKLIKQIEAHSKLPLKNLDQAKHNAERPPHYQTRPLLPPVSTARRMLCLCTRAFRLDARIHIASVCTLYVDEPIWHNMNQRPYKWGRTPL